MVRRLIPDSVQRSSSGLPLMHTDGIRWCFHVEDLPHVLQTNPQQLADGNLARPDDATVVVVRHTG